LLRVLDGETSYLELVELPVAQPLDIDLAQLARIRVRVARPDGSAAVGHVVGLSGDDGRSERCHVVERGEGRFTTLAPGRYTVLAPYVTTTSSFGGDITEVVDLPRGGDVLVTLGVPDSSRPRCLVISVTGTETFVGWRARFGDGAWVEVEPGGRVPLDLNTDQWWLHVSAPDGRRWHVALPRGAADGHVVELTPGTGRFEGVLLDEDGAPQARVTLRFTPFGTFAERPTSHCLTDDAGRFSIGGLALSVHQVEIRRDLDAGPSTDGADRLERTKFQTSVASAEGAWLELRVARPRPSARLSGTVRGADGRPLHGGLVWCRVEVHGDAAGALVQLVAGGTAFQRLDEQGAFSLDVPRHERCILRVFGPERGQEALHERTIDLSGDGEMPSLDLVVQ
jgi:hypothetical protein